MKNVIVADIDGCCVHSEDRLPFLLNGDEDLYHSNHKMDTPIPQGVAVYRKFLADNDFDFYFVTGRMEIARAYTLNQLRTWISPHIVTSQLIMRPNHITGKMMHDTELKFSMLESRGVTPEKIFLVFEDRSSIVQMWRALGVVCYQTAFGDW